MHTNTEIVYGQTVKIELNDLTDKIRYRINVSVTFGTSFISKIHIHSFILKIHCEFSLFSLHFNKKTAKPFPLTTMK